MVNVIGGTDGFEEWPFGMASGMSYSGLPATAVIEVNNKPGSIPTIVIRVRVYRK